MTDFSYSEIDCSFFIVTVDLWSADGKQQNNLVLHPTTVDRFTPSHPPPKSHKGKSTSGSTPTLHPGASGSQTPVEETSPTPAQRYRPDEQVCLTDFLDKIHVYDRFSGPIHRQRWVVAHPIRIKDLMPLKKDRVRTSHHILLRTGLHLLINMLLGVTLLHLPAVIMIPPISLPYIPSIVDRPILTLLEIGNPSLLHPRSIASGAAGIVTIPPLTTTIIMSTQD